MPGTRVRPLAGPSINLVPGIHVFKLRNRRLRWPGIGERSDAVLRTAMSRHDGTEIGQLMTIVYDQLMALQLPPTVQLYDAKDCMLYALSVGLGHDPTNEDELPFV